jgi:hypothetical protein
MDKSSRALTQSNNRVRPNNRVRSQIKGAAAAIMLATLTLLVANPAAMAKESGKTVSAKGVSLTIPATWTVFAVDDPKLDVILASAKKANPQLTLTPDSMKSTGTILLAVNSKPKDPSFAENVNVVLVPGAPKSLKGLDVEFKKVLETQGAVVVSQKTEKMAGVDALRTEYKLPINGQNGKKLTVIGTQIVAIKGGQLTILTLSLGAANKPVVDAMAKSLKIK